MYYMADGMEPKGSGGTDKEEPQKLQTRPPATILENQSWDGSPFALESCSRISYMCSCVRVTVYESYNSQASSSQLFTLPG
ncbi:hypothetical protein KQX54_007774 [Cotesia glomerata]|uniref:Uncharacterized protein n=1 Tax=Cotesia glomerata TaxID=32391 RepID=A0AAV7IZ59_COTGL|nr:hypothetical protein KQX54_007774 [Cotesia glomerata]